MTVSPFVFLSERSKICESLHEGVELLTIDLPTSILVKLVIALLKVLIVPGLVLSRLLHDVLDEVLQVVLRNVRLALVVFIQQAWVVLLENLVSKLAHLLLDFSLS